MNSATSNAYEGQREMFNEANLRASGVNRVFSAGIDTQRNLSMNLGGIPDTKVLALLKNPTNVPVTLNIKTGLLEATVFAHGPKGFITSQTIPILLTGGNLQALMASLLKHPYIQTRLIQLSVDQEQAKVLQEQQAREAVKAAEEKSRKDAELQKAQQEAQMAVQQAKQAKLKAKEIGSQYDAKYKPSLLSRFNPFAKKTGGSRRRRSNRRNTRRRY
jgi:hypothetical protein